MVKPTPKKKLTSAKHKTGGSGGCGGGAQTKILNAAAANKTTTGEDLDRKHISAVTGITGASTIRNALAGLKTKEWIQVTPEKIIVTDEGMEHADTSGVEVPTSNADFHEKMMTQYKLKPKAIAVFHFLADGRTYTKQEVADEIFDGKMNSTFRNTLAELSKPGIIERGSDGIRFTEKMFPIVPRPVQLQF